MKKIWKVLGIIAGVIAVIVIVALFATSGLRSTADEFFGAVKQQDMAKARTYLSEEFKASTDDAALKAFLSNSALLNFKEASWSESNIDNGRGELNGLITTETGGHIPIKLMFVKEHEAWKIYALQKPTAGLQSSQPAETPAIASSAQPVATVPAAADQINMSRQAMHDFALSVKSKNMEHFRSTISQLWQSQFTTQQLNDAYGQIIKANLDLTVVDPLQPVLDGNAALDDKGVLTIKGHYATHPSTLYFEDNFIYEGVAWKLIGLNIHIK
jgi:hypothetical protein